MSEAARKLSNMSARNPRYRGATPADMARIMLGKKPACHPEKKPDETSPVKTSI